MRFSLIRCVTLAGLACLLAAQSSALHAEVPEKIWEQAGANRTELESALEQAPEQHREAVEFLIRNMPQRDLESLSADYLLANTRLAYEAREATSWGKRIPEPIFLNNVLPYVSINERRDNWRQDFYKRFLPLVKEAKSPGEAATILNRQIFKQLNVKYSTKRKKADQSPYETIEGGTASCTGLSVLLIDACRAVGVPARMVGTPLWTNKSGNHSWVEVWDGGWRFTGAAEPTGDSLDRGWFVGRAATAIRDKPIHAIYATSFKKTPLYFPCVWNPRIKYVSAVNVTDRYTALKKELPEGYVEPQFVVRGADGERVAAPLRILADGKTIYDGFSNDERFDANDHICVPLPRGRQLQLEVQFGDNQIRRAFTPRDSDQLIAIELEEQPQAEPQDEPQEEEPEEADEGQPIQQLRAYLKRPFDSRPALAEQPFATVPLNRGAAALATRLLVADRHERLRVERADEMKARELKLGELKMPFFYKKFGKKPGYGWPLYISLHGGGGAPKRINDQQWENQKRLYQLKDGIYVAPRAPTNTWNLWHQGHIDPLFDRLIENLAIFEDVDWNRVYVMGYSAGGDGVFQLAPRMADRWAAAAMMAGHPNETSPLGLRNVPFALQMGGRDSAYNRNKIAVKWKEQLAELRAADKAGYEHFVKIYPDKGHWMDREDAVAIPWMAKYVRNPVPHRVVWKQDDVTHSRFYWLAVDDENRRARTEIRAEVEDQTVTVQGDVERLTVLLDDRLLDLNKPVTVRGINGKPLFEGMLNRTIANLATTLERRGDPHLSFGAAVTVELPKPFPDAFVPAADLPKYAAARVESPLVVDGKLDESAWKKAAKTGAFVDLISGQPTRHDTQAAILWDDDYLYIGFWIAEPNVTAKYKNRDDPLYYDNDAEVFIAGANAYYEFEINAYGTVYEGLFIWESAFEKDGYGEDPQLKRGAPNSQPFNGVGFKQHPRGRRIAFLGYDFPEFQSAVHIDGTLNDDSDVDKGWTIELAFPWKQMKWLAKGDGRSLPPKPDDEWRINLFRFNTEKGPPATDGSKDSGGWAWGKHGVWDSHVPELFPLVKFKR